MNISLTLGHRLSGTDMLWSHAVNPHIAVYGQSGTGKSFFLRQLLIQAAQQGALCLVFDYSGDFRNYIPPDGIPFCRIDVSGPDFSLNPLVSMSSGDDDLCVQQLLCALHSIFRMGARASLKLRQVTQRYLASEAGFPTLNGLLQYVQKQEVSTSGLLAALEPMELLSTMVHCGNQPIGLDLNSPGLVVLDFARIFDRQVRNLFVELILQAVWAHRIHSVGGCPIVLLLDECQNLSWGVNSMAVRILREGRKYDLAGWFATQWINDKATSSTLGQAALQAHFRPDEQNVRRLAKILCPHDAKELDAYQRLIRSLSQGQFLMKTDPGPVLRVQV